MNKAKYQLIDNYLGEVVAEGTYEDVLVKKRFKLVKKGYIEPIYEATWDTKNNNVERRVTGTIKNLSKILKCDPITLYNYTRYKRKKDKLFLRRVK